jgi:hypothetical protein
MFLSLGYENNSGGVRKGQNAMLEALKEVD